MVYIKKYMKVNIENKKLILNKTSNGVNMEYNTPLHKRCKSKLTLVNESGNSVQLDCKQIRALRHLLDKGNCLKSKSFKR